jgi:hypothetical protein
MSSSFLVQFNGVNLESPVSMSPVSVALRPDGIDAPAELAEEMIPRRQGSVVQAALKKSRLLKLTGQVGGSGYTADQVQAILDALRSTCMPINGVQELYIGRDDRFYYAQAESYTESYEDGVFYNVIADIAIGFRAADPDAYGALAASPITEGPVSVSLGSNSLTPVGNSTTHPWWTITINAAGTGSIYLTNSTTGQVCVVTGTFANADVILLDARLSSYGSYYNSVLDYGLFTGPIPDLWPTANTILLQIQMVETATITGAPTGGTFTISYGGHTTSGIAYDATAATVQTALAALASIGAGNVTVSGNGGVLGTAGGPYTITLTLALGSTNVFTASGAGLTGGTSPGVTIARVAPTITSCTFEYAPRYA